MRAVMPTFNSFILINMDNNIHNNVELELTSSQQTLTIDLNQWKYHNQGCDHILLAYCKENEENELFLNKVLIFEKSNKSSHMQNKLNQAYQNHILNKLPISKHINTRKQYQIIGKDHQQNVLRFMRRQTNKQSIKLNPQKCFISQNLFTPQWNIIVQFKPKTPLPDKYSQNTIQMISKQMNVSTQNIQSIIRQAKPYEKTRWYKKSLTQKQGQRNQNPLSIFQIQSQSQSQSQHKIIPNYLSTKCYKYVDNTLEGKEINKTIHQTIQSSNILKEIYKLQSAFTKSFSFVQFQQLQQVQEIEHTKVVQEIHSFKDYHNEQLYEYLEITNCKQEVEDKILSNSQKWEHVFRFLISLTWRDISLIVRLKCTHQQEVQEYSIHVIDYDLKPITKIKENQKKDLQLLKHYLNHKQI